MIAMFKRQDWFLNAAVGVLVAVSLVTLASTNKSLFLQQALWSLLGIGVALGFAKVDWRPLVNYRWVIAVIYGGALVLLLLTVFAAPVIRQTRSWIVLGPVTIQTSEFSKIALIILFAYFFARKHIGIARMSVLVKSFFYFAIPTGFILMQPDVGSALILLFIWIGFLLVSGIRWRHLLIGFILFAIIGIVGWQFFLKDYHKERIIAFLYPSYDPLGVNYSSIQAKTALGSAGLWGKGFHQGTQIQLGFLPAASTDFIFAAFVEEWGVLFGIMLLFVFAFLLLRIVMIGMRCHNNFSKLVCLGTVIMFLAQFILNIGSTLGLSPVIGVTLPFVSYGGSSLLTNFILVGMIQSIVIRTSFLKEVSI